MFGPITAPSKQWTPVNTPPYKWLWCLHRDIYKSEINSSILIYMGRNDFPYDFELIIGLSTLRLKVHFGVLEQLNSERTNYPSYNYVLRECVRYNLNVETKAAGIVIP